jgi:hypothetical protein
MRWGSDIRRQACESEAPARDARLFLDVFFTEGSMDVPERLPPRPLRYRGRGFGAKAPSVSRNSFRPSYRRRGFRRDPLRHREPGARGCRSSLHRDPLPHRRRVFGAKAPPTETDFRRSGFRRDLRVIENPGVRSYQSRFSCDPCVIEDGRFGAKAPPTKTIFL